jgi:hypothetical protein
MIFNYQICTLVLDGHVKKCLINYSTRKKNVIFVGTKVGIGATPLALPKLFTSLEKIPILEVTSGLVGHGSNATTKSTSIFPLSLCSSFPCILNSNVNMEWACILPKSKGGIIC